MALIENIAFAVLREEDDAFGILSIVASVGLPGRVDALCQSFRGVVLREVQRLLSGIFEKVVFGDVQESGWSVPNACHRWIHILLVETRGVL